MMLATFGAPDAGLQVIAGRFAALAPHDPAERARLTAKLSRQP